MTNEERTKVMNLRAGGLGYKKISQIVGLPESTVKSFCKRNQVALNTKPSEVSGHFCLSCGKPVVQNPRRKEKKFCCDKCRMMWWNNRLDKVKRKAVYTLICQSCGKEFTVYGKANRKYCCHECYVEDRFGGGKK